jgi:hypothetical protein
MTLAAGTADSGTIARLTNVVEEFRQYYDKLHNVSYGAAIARLGDNQLTHDFGKELYASEAMKDRIEVVTGAWDRIKEWAGLAAIPFIPIAIALGLIAAVTGSIVAIRTFMRRADIALAIKQDPTLSYEQAADQVERAQQGTFGKALDVAQLGFFAVLAFIAYQLFARR